MAEGSLRASAPGLASRLRTVNAPIVFGDSTVKLDDLAAGEVVVQCWVEVKTAFNAASTNVITLGTAADDDYYLTASDVTEGTPGVYPTGGKGPFRAEPTADVLNVKYAQSGTAATTGSAVAWAVIASVAE